MSKLIDGESVDNNGVEVSADREPIAPEVLEGRRLRGFPDVDKGKTSGPVTLEDGSVLTGGRDRQSAHGRPLADRYLGPSVPHAWPYAVAFLALGMLLIWPLVGASACTEVSETRSLDDEPLPFQGRSLRTRG